MVLGRDCVGEAREIIRVAQSRAVHGNGDQRGAPVELFVDRHQVVLADGSREDSEYDRHDPYEHRQTGEYGSQGGEP